MPPRRGDVLGGWTQHQNWSKSVAQTCGDNSSCGCSDGHTPTCACSTRGSEWGNEAPPQCTYYVNAGECTGYQCSAQVTQIGCR